MHRTLAAFLVLVGATCQLGLYGRYSTGPEAVLTLPLAAMIYVAVALAAGFLAARASRKVVRGAVGLVALVGVLFAVTELHATGGKLTPRAYGLGLVRSAMSWSEVSYADVYAEGTQNAPLRAVASRKFADRLPEFALLAVYWPNAAPWEDSKHFVLELRGARWTSVPLSRFDEVIGVERWSGREEIAIRFGAEVFTMIRTPEPWGETHYVQAGEQRADGAPRLVVTEWPP